MKIIALLTASGTACLETALYGEDDTPENRAKVERETINEYAAKTQGDLPVAGSWTDVSENEAFHYWLDNE